METPYEVLKCQMQDSRECRLPLTAAASRTYARFGLPGFYRGLSAFVCR